MDYFDTPVELISKLGVMIEKERKRQQLQQTELSQKAGVPVGTYRDFLYKRKISLEALFKIMMALRLFDNLEALVKEKEIQTLDEMRKVNDLPKRIKK